MTPEELLAEHDSLLRMLDDHAAVSMLQKDNTGILFTVLANTFSAERDSIPTDVFEAEVERRVEHLWGKLPASDGIRRTVSDTVTARTRREIAEAHKRLQSAQRVLTDAEPAHSRMADLLRTDALPGDIFLEKTEQLRKQVETARAEIQEQSHILSTHQSTLRSLAAEAEQDPHAVYRAASPIIRQQLNQAVFTAIRIGRGDESITYDLA